MIAFAAIAAAMSLAAGAAIAFALLRAPNRARATSDEINAAVYRDQLAELDAALAEGTLSAAHHAQARQAIRQRLAQDLAGAAARAPRVATASTRRTAVALAAMLPLCGALLYGLLGNPAALDAAKRAAPSQQGAHALQGQQMAAMIERLAARLRENPGDLNGWVMLARSYSAIGRFDEASRAYAQAARIAPRDAPLLADYADVLAMAQGRRFDGEPDRLVARALAVDPRHAKSLALAGTSAYNRRDFKAAIDHWTQLREQLPDGSQMAGTIDASLVQARQQLAGNGTPAKAAAAPAVRGFVAGMVKLDAKLASRVAPGDTLFVYARPPQGSRMPVAILKRPVGAWPAAFRLDDSSAMTGTRLSGLRQVVLEARISRSGTAAAAAGDLRATSGPVDVGREDVVLEIDSVAQ
ncbi:MAG TPA: c-type cytochrome biogenesis protein CcmI [Usitatibacter sp.]|nr:c-type cytochrome biogenesis protein CcmI [Usitatibacter sp.]